MDYNRNEDKWRPKPSGLYNNVLSVSFSNEGSEPVDSAEVKLWAKIENTEDDTIVSALITAARKVCEKFSGVGFISRTITMNIENCNGGFNLPYGPVTVDPTAIDADGNTVTLTYQFGQIQEPFGKMMVTYTAGHSTLPDDLKAALKAQITFMYDNRGEGSVGLSPIAKMILEPQREVV